MCARTASIVVAICLALSACAGGMQRNGIVRIEPRGSQVDYVKVLAVNQWAERRGASVIWVNYPVRLKRARDTEG